jgi:hypothetical protein
VGVYDKTDEHTQQVHEMFVLSKRTIYAFTSFLLFFLVLCDGQLTFEFCDDSQPRGGHSCDKQKSWGKCAEQWFVDGNYCRRTCGKCVDFDPRMTETKLRSAMTKECQLEDEKLIQTCLDMVQGHEISGFRIRTVESTKVAQSSMEELLESTHFFETFTKCKLDCVIRQSSDELVYALVQNFLDVHEPTSKKMRAVLTEEHASVILLDFFKHIGCSADQFAAIVPQFYRALMDSTALNENQLLPKIYRLQSFDAQANETITFTSEYQGHPSVSTCLGKNLKFILNSVRDCDDYNCYN